MQQDQTLALTHSFSLYPGTVVWLGHVYFNIYIYSKHVITQCGEV